MARKSQTKIDRDVALATLRETADDGELIGRDPRKVSPEEWARAGISGRAILGAIRAKRLDCCVFQIDEVRKCTAVGCAPWPYRMGFNLDRETATHLMLHVHYAGIGECGVYPQEIAKAKADQVMDLPPQCVIEREP